MSSPLRSCEEDEGMVVNSEGGDFDEEDDDDGDPDEIASDINSPAAPRETATPAAPGTLKKKGKYRRTTRKRVPQMDNTIAINSVEGRQADWVPQQICALRCVSSEDKRRARRPASKFADPIAEKQDTRSTSPPQCPRTLSKENWRFCADAGFLSPSSSRTTPTRREKLQPTRHRRFPSRTLLSLQNLKKSCLLLHRPFRFFDSCRDLA